MGNNNATGNGNQGLLGKTAVYIITSILTQVLNLFLIPLYTNHFSPALFGEFTIVTSLQGILSFFVSLGIFSGLSRFYYETEDPVRLKNITVTFSLLWGSVMVAVCLIAAPQIASLVFKGAPDGPVLTRLVAVNAFLLCLINTYTTYMTMGYYALKSGLISMFNLLLTVIFTIYLVAVLRLGVLGALQAQVYAAAVVFSWLLLSDLRDFRFAWERTLFGRMLGYGVGLLPGQLGCWVLMLVDRYFLKAMVNLGAVGVYSMGYKIGVLIQPLLMAPFKNIFTPYKFEVYKQPDGQAKILRLFNYYNFIGWLLVLGLSVFAGPALRILATTAYESAYRVVPIVACAYFILSLGEFYSMGLHIANQTMIDSWVVIGGAVIDLGLNYLLIPRWGMYGAAFAVLIAYLAMMISYYFLSGPYYKLGIGFGLPCRYAVVFTLIYGIYFYLKPQIHHLGLEVLLGFGLCLLFILLSYRVGLLPKDALDLAGQALAKVKIRLGLATPQGENREGQ
ncbi:MAG TPA: oligosaccharide flippase family protein [Bacillota bacterium]|nr:oligosaccharide flippase family protein [Bacillota bacterium]